MKNIFITSSFIVLTLCGCSTTSPTISGPEPQITYANLQAIGIPVSEIVVQNNYDPAVIPGNKATSFPTPPDVALRRYFENRFLAKGNEESGKLVVSIEDAGVHHRILKSDNSFGALFGIGSTEEYDLDVAIEMTHLGPQGQEWAISDVRYDKLKTYPSDLSLAELEKELSKFVRDAIVAIDVPVQENVAKIMRESQAKRVESQLQAYPVNSVIKEDAGLPDRTAPSQMTPILD